MNHAVNFIIIECKEWYLDSAFVNRLNTLTKIFFTKIAGTSTVLDDVVSGRRGGVQTKHGSVDGAARELVHARKGRCLGRRRNYKL